MASRFDTLRLEAVDRLAERELAETRLPGLAVAITGPDGPAKVRTFGLADAAAARPVDPATLFEIGSIGKAFTAIVILQLAEEGRLDLHAPVSAALPWFEMPVVGRPVTLHDLLSHTAGITSGVDETPEAAFQVLALRHRRPGSAPGERFHYSNLGYKALGLVIEAVEGRPYAEVLQSRVLEPLAMTATEPAITHAIRPRLAVGYDYLHDDRIGYPGRPLAPATWLETATADGSIASTAGDMAEFARLLLRRGEGPAGRLLGEDSFARMVGPHVRPTPDSGYGYGLATRNLGDRVLVGHPGGMVGYLAAVQVEPAAGVGVVVLANGMMGRPLSLARAVLGAMGGGAERGAAAATDADAGPEPSPDLAGVYRREGGAAGDAAPAAFEVIGGAGGPSLRLGEAVARLDPVGDGQFVVHHPHMDRFLLRFEPPGERPEVAWRGPARFVRDGAFPAPAPSPGPALAPLAGHYRSYNPWTTNFRVFVRGDTPWLAFPAAPDGFEDEQPLVARPDGSFRVGADPDGPEDVRFDTLVEGRPLRAWLSGVPYFRVG